MQNISSEIIIVDVGLNTERSERMTPKGPVQGKQSVRLIKLKFWTSGAGGHLVLPHRHSTCLEGKSKWGCQITPVIPSTSAFPHWTHGNVTSGGKHACGLWQSYKWSELEPQDIAILKQLKITEDH